MLTERTVTQRIWTSLNNPLQWLQQTCVDHSWTFLFNSNRATGWQQRLQSVSSVHAIYLSTNLQQWGLARYTEYQQWLQEALTETSLKLCQGKYCERQAAMEMGATQLWFVLSKTSMHLVLCDRAFSCPCIQLSPLLSTWCARSVCSVCMWHHVCFWFGRSTQFLNT